jgi:hypothetical protein
MNKYAVFLLFALSACNNPELKPASGKQDYFALNAYFQKEALRLQRTSPVVDKTVLANGKTERKHLKIRSWTKELSSFIEADINKKAWAGEFKKTVNDSTETYLSSNEKVPVKKVAIFRRDKQIAGIVIIIKNKNYLYTSTDTLSYYPDKWYEVKKTQQIKLMSKKQYRINGVF